MKLVVDTNILISALIRNSTDRKIIFTSNFEFHVPEHAFSEVDKHRRMILSKSALDEANYELFLNLLKSRVSIASKETINTKFEEAKSIMDGIDRGDTVYTTKELLKML